MMNRNKANYTTEQILRERTILPYSHTIYFHLRECALQTSEMSSFPDDMNNRTVSTTVYQGGIMKRRAIITCLFVNTTLVVQIELCETRVNSKRFIMHSIATRNVLHPILIITIYTESHQKEIFIWTQSNLSLKESCKIN